MTLKGDQAYFLKDKYKYEQSRCTLDKTLEKMNCILVKKDFSIEKSNRGKNDFSDDDSLSACFLSDMAICHHLLVTRGKTRQMKITGNYTLVEQFFLKAFTTQNKKVIKLVISKK